MTSIKVTVVIVTYRSADLAIGCLRSLDVERSTPGIQTRAVIVDNASGDSPSISAAIEANGWHTWATLVEASSNGGFAYGNNVAFQRAYEEGPPKYLLMLNPDTIVLKGAIGALVRFLEDHSEVGIVGGSFENADGSDWPMAFRFPSILGELEQGIQLRLVTSLLRPWVVGVQMTPQAQPIDWVSGASMMIRREVLDAIGGLDENYFLYFEETDFCLRARRSGFSTWYVPESRVVHIAGQSTKVTERDAAPRRLPSYWFQSRRRYFLVNHGVSYAIAADILALVGHSLGSLKRMVQGRKKLGIPCFRRDLLKHSAIWKKNRREPAIRNVIHASTVP